MDVETIQQASALHQQSQEIEEKAQFVENQILELEQFILSLDEIINTKEKSMISSLGKGVHLKTQLESKDLLVEVGSGVVVKKTPEDTKKVIESQIKKLKELKIQLTSQLEETHQHLQGLIAEIEKSQKEASKKKTK
ncbi:hypothetical protein CMI47_14160 [Candidatus Pacearchaeota archaeon]|nr:hypothetical protein [Candidatus Pacearchaeota archaeon]